MTGRRFTVRNEAFSCAVCGSQVPPLATGCRNHCPHCLHSLHVDVWPGDRAAECGGVMEPVRIETHGKKGYIVIHRCTRCKEETKNKLALSDEAYPDELAAVLQVMRESARRGPGQRS